MRIDWAQVESIIRNDSVRLDAGPQRMCPCPDDLVRFVEGGTSRKARARTMEHLASCVDCARIVQSLLRLGGEVDKLTGMPGTLQSDPSARFQGRRESHEVPWRRRTVFATLGLGVLAVVTIFLIRISDRPVVRGVSGVEIKLTYPKRGEAVTSGDIEFRWEAVPRASRYVVDLFGSALEKILSSEPVIDPSYELPANAGQALAAGYTFFWRVTAILEDGQEIISNLSEFSVRK
jgi:hypothetical protein